MRQYGVLAPLGQVPRQRGEVSLLHVAVAVAVGVGHINRVLAARLIVLTFGEVARERGNVSLLYGAVAVDIAVENSNLSAIAAATTGDRERGNRFPPLPLTKVL